MILIFNPEKACATKSNVGGFDIACCQTVFNNKTKTEKETKKKKKQC
jgi:hypothetical protein